MDTIRSVSHHVVKECASCQQIMFEINDNIMKRDFIKGWRHNDRYNIENKHSET